MTTSRRSSPRPGAVFLLLVLLFASVLPAAARAGSLLPLYQSAFILPWQPVNLFVIGDSISVAEAARGDLRAIHPESSWSGGHDPADGVRSINEALAGADRGSRYQAQEAASVEIFTQAFSGADMADFSAQAGTLLEALPRTRAGEAGMVTILLGNNDVCADSLEEMTDPALFESFLRAGLDRLAGDGRTREARIVVVGIPAIYWLWNAKADDDWCRLAAWPFVPCRNLLDDPADDCQDAASRLDPDHIQPGDGPACVRRKTVHARIRDTYNPILGRVTEEYREDGRLPRAVYVDIMDVRFGDAEVNDADCFHPSLTGQDLLGTTVFDRLP